MEKTIEKPMRDFKFFGTAAIIYAVVHVFCLWHNFDGILVPLWTVSLLAYLLVCMRKFEWKTRKDSVIYMVVMILLGVSTCLTRDIGIIIMNYFFIMALFAMIVIRHMCRDHDFGILKYIGSIFVVVFAPVGFIAQPFIEQAEYHKAHKKGMSASLKGVLIGLLVAVPMLAVILWLLASADIVFAQMVLHLEWLMPYRWFGKLFMILIIYILAYGAGVCYEKNLLRGLETPDAEGVAVNSGTRGWNPASGITFCVLLAAVYLVFSGIQVVYLFAGGAALPDSYSYAEYAREGYFQLFFVCLINLGILIFCRSFYQTNRVLQVLLAVISACTFVMIASSAYRMVLYVQTYGLSVLRVLVFWSLAVLVIWMIGVFLFIWKERFPLFRFGMIALACMYLLLAFAKKDYWIAHYNLNVAQTEGEADIRYLARLSEDAAPVLADYYLEHRKETGEESYRLYSYFNRILTKDDRSWRCFNFAEKSARDSAGKVLGMDAAKER